MVAERNFQIFGEKYVETPAPVISFDFVRISLYLALNLNIFWAQLDVIVALLNTPLSENICVMSPKGTDGRPSRCYKLKKAIYVFKKAHLAWSKCVCHDLHKICFKELSSAPWVFELMIVHLEENYFYWYILMIYYYNGPRNKESNFYLKALRKGMRWGSLYTWNGFPVSNKVGYMINNITQIDCHSHNQYTSTAFFDDLISKIVDLFPLQWSGRFGPRYLVKLSSQ